MRTVSALIFVALVALTGSSSAAEAPDIARAQFCTAIVDREPGDAPESITAGLQTLYFFTEILNGKDSTVSHKWFYNDVPIADVSLQVGADRWRTWSTKQVWHLAPGTLKVQVIGPEEQILSEKEIPLQK